MSDTHLKMIEQSPGRFAAGETLQHFNRMLNSFDSEFKFGTIIQGLVAKNPDRNSDFLIGVTFIIYDRHTKELGRIHISGKEEFGETTFRNVVSKLTRLYGDNSDSKRFVSPQNQLKPFLTPAQEIGVNE